MISVKNRRTRCSWKNNMNELRVGRVNAKSVKYFGLNIADLWQ